MQDEAHMLIVKKKRRLCISRNLNINRTWKIIGPIIAQEIGAPDYSRIPHIFDTNAYQIGHIFVPVSTQISCFRTVPVLKILGPIRDFALKGETNVKWLSKGIPSVRTSGDKANFRVILEHGKNQINVTGYNYYFLSKAHDMLTLGNITINRAAHEDLSRTKWFGLITNVIVTKTFEFRITRKLRERTLHIGEEHTIFIKYEICEIDENGTVTKSEVKKIRCKWLPIKEQESDNLPLTQLQNMIQKTR